MEQCVARPVQAWRRCGAERRGSLSTRACWCSSRALMAVAIMRTPSGGSGRARSPCDGCQLDVAAKHAVAVHWPASSGRGPETSESWRRLIQLAPTTLIAAVAVLERITPGRGIASPSRLRRRSEVPPSRSRQLALGGVAKGANAVQVRVDGRRCRWWSSTPEHSTRC